MTRPGPFHKGINFFVVFGAPILVDGGLMLRTNTASPGS